MSEWLVRDPVVVDQGVVVDGGNWRDPVLVNPGVQVDGGRWLVVSGPQGEQGPKGDDSTVPGPQGPVGPQGPQGDPGVTAYAHHQGIASRVWTVVHNLGWQPNVTVVDSAGTTVEGDIAYLGPNSLTLTFSSAFAGVAYLS